MSKYSFSTLVREVGEAQSSTGSVVISKNTIPLDKAAVINNPGTNTAYGCLAQSD